MKKIIYLFAGLLFACQDRQVQNDSASIHPVYTVETLPTNVDEIKLMYAATMKKLTDKVLDSFVKSYNCDGERSGTVTYYLEHQKLKSIKHVYAEYSHHEATDTYFVQDTVLYFAHLKHLNWSFESGAAVDGATRDDITENRFYLIAGKLVQCLEKKYTNHSSSSNLTVADRIPNKTVECKSADLLKSFKKLESFRKVDRSDCLEK